jgi:methyl-accepting chemotaxis protein
MKRLRVLGNVNISVKILGIALFVIAVASLALVFKFLPMIEAKLMSEKKSATMNVVDVAYTLIVDYDDRAKKGEMSLDAAKRLAFSSISNLRYKKDEYFFIIDMQARMIMHPIKPELNGKDMRDSKDPAGKALFQEMADVCKEKEGGFVDYLWEKPGTNIPVPKITYVKLFKPWGYIIGNGVYVDDVNEEITGMRNGVFVAVTAGSVVTFFLVIGGAMVITRPLKDGVVVANKMSEGDFAVNDVNVIFRDEAGTLANALNKTKNDLSRLFSSSISSVTSTAEQAAAVSSQLSQTANHMTQRLNEQASRSAQVATASAEMSQTVVDIAKNAANIATSAADTLSIAQEGGNVVSQTIGEVHEISSSVAESSLLIKALGDKSKQIFEIVDVIKDIADQTNLLALNAAIEAARAGEQGRGFAVVADEVRKLAEKTSRATTEVGSMIGSIQQETEKAVNAMAKNQDRVEKGVALSTEAGNALNNILDSVNGLQSMVQQIASATEEMSTVSEQISNGIEMIAGVSKETNEKAVDIETASNNLAQLSSDLHEVTQKLSTIKTAS